MHFLLSKLLELVRMEQEPLRVFPTAHFSSALARCDALKKRDLAHANLLVGPWN